MNQGHLTVVGEAIEIMLSLSYLRLIINLLIAIFGKSRGALKGKNKF